MSPFDALILGIVEGFTEFLPISSTGHLILASNLLHITQSDFTKSFEIIIQSGAILAVVVLFWRQFLNIELLKKLFVSFIPTGVIGLALYSFVKTYLIGNESVVLASLFLGGLILIGFEYWHREGEQEELAMITYKQAFLIGCFQAIAIIPGVSRSAATILGGMALGMRRALIVEYSFLLAVPTMAAATGLDVLKHPDVLASNHFFTLALGFLVSFVTAVVAIRFLLAFVRKYSFAPFGYYRIALAALFLVIR